MTRRAEQGAAADLLAAARSQGPAPLYLVAGDRALAEPAAERFAAALAEPLGVAPETLRHPDDLPAVVADLRTYSLFSTGKVVVALETGVLADRDAAAGLLKAAQAEAPFTGGPESLTGRSREAALALLRVLRLFDIDPAAETPQRALARLPGTLFSGARGRTSARKGTPAGEEDADPRAGLEPLLSAAVAAGLRGIGESEASLLADLLRDGLPEGHTLILVESAVATGHPLLAALRQRGAVLEVGWLAAAQRGGTFDGLDALVAVLARETGVGIEDPAARELARRTLRAADRFGGTKAISGDSSARFGAEYRKLATLAGGDQISVEAVRGQVEDRGEESAFTVIDAIAAGDPGRALEALERMLAGAEDREAEQLLFFGQLARFARQLTAMRGAARLAGVQGGERFFPKFKSDIAPRLQGKLEGIEENPLKGNPYPLQRPYLAASRFDEAELERLPALVLETERRLKGDSGEAGAALAALVLRLAAARAASSAAPSRSGSRAPAGGGGRS